MQAAPEQDMPSLDELMARAANEPMENILKDAEKLYEQSMKSAVGLVNGRYEPPAGMTKEEALAALRETVLTMRILMDRYGWKYNAYES